MSNPVTYDLSYIEELEAQIRRQKVEIEWRVIEMCEMRADIKRLHAQRDDWRNAYEALRERLKDADRPD